MDVRTILNIEASINKNHHLVSNILQNNAIPDVISDQSSLNTISNQFNIELKLNSIPQQYNSGRCWIFAATNVLRHKMITKYKLSKDFELSQAYISKYDKIEKCLYTLEKLYKLSKTNIPIDSIEVYTTVDICIQDGGTWGNFVNLITKYGIVPKEVFPDTYQIKHTDYMNSLLKVLINRAKTKIFSKECKNKTNFIKIRDIVMEDCIKVILMCIGTSPMTFKWRTGIEMYDKEYNALSFYKKFVYPVNKMVNLIHLPIYDTELVLKTDSNFVEISNNYYNTNIDILKKAMYLCLTREKMPIFFSCYVDSKYFFSNGYILDTKSSMVEELFDINISESKRNSILNDNNIANHAMMISGCQYDPKTKHISKWKIQNSWGNYNDKEGIIIMTDDFFIKYIADVVVPVSCLPKGYINKFKKDKYVDTFALLC